MTISDEIRDLAAEETIEKVKESPMDWFIITS